MQIKEELGSGADETGKNLSNIALKIFTKGYKVESDVTQ